MNKVRDVWESTHVVGWAGFRLKSKLKALKEALKVWNKEVFGIVEFKIKEAKEELQALEIISEERSLHEEELVRRREVKGELWKLRKVKEWIRSRNLMDSITIKGNTFNNPAEMKKEIASYFGEVFAEHWKDRPKIGRMYRSIELAQAEMLEKEFFESEIWASIKECDGNKAPGLDGFNLISTQKGWKIMKVDILKFMAKFHENDVENDTALGT
ncbi:uncharacterized protein LOC114256192 [Camellia sinensis]|uniref:uncharacterized protein LOC114256192 n=1 Tax=Camellia sinensis TaxID=4442 RepID=UPI001036D3E2|nr:uncharacterized protein LOC114256192 [Camellia sinensis]